MLRRSCSLLSLLVLTSAVPGPAGAAELGDARVSSHIGQQLVADIELVMVEDPAAPVAVRVASPEVYSGAGIALPPLLSSLNLSVMRRDGRQFLHVTSLRPVDADHLHLYLELLDKGQRVVRLATLWLTPDPHPAPPPAPAPVPVSPPVPVPEPLLAPAPAPLPAERKKPVPLVPLRKPAPPAVIHAAIHADSQPAACVRQPDEAQACAALGVKNAALREQLGKLEDKVKGLQQMMGTAPAHEEHKPEAPAAEATPPEPKPIAKPIGPKPISAIKPLVPHKPKAAPPKEGGAPWGWIVAGIALLAAIGGATVFALKRRARSRNVDIPAEPGMLDKLRQRLPARSKK
jgi:hypothetical protein